MWKKNMTPIKNCNTCAWCTEKNFEDQDGICSEPHAPRNAKGQITSRTRLGTLACRKYKPATDIRTAEVTCIVTADAPAKRHRTRVKKPVTTEDVLGVSSPQAGEDKIGKSAAVPERFP